MINQSRLKITKSYDFPISTTVTTLTEGSALVQVFDPIDGVGKVQASTGTANELFVGVSYSQMMTPTTFPRMENITVPALSPYTLTLQRTPIASTSIGVKRVSDNTMMTIDTTGNPATNHVKLVGNILTFNAADAGLAFITIYRYNLSVVEARTIAGDGVLGASNSVIEAGSVGVIQAGQVFTDQYDPTVDWNSASEVGITTGSGGVFTRGGSGGAVVGYVLRAPTNEDPYLGIMINA